MLGILTGFDENYLLYEDACKELDVEYKIIDLLSPDWLDNVKSSECDGFLVRPPCSIIERYNIFMERLYVINCLLEYPIYPSYRELFLYENKCAMATWLEINRFPFLKTDVFLRKSEALDFIGNAQYPLVFKSKIGAGGSCVDIVKTKRKAKARIKNAFGRIHPIFCIGQIMTQKYRHLPFFNIGSAQKHYAIIQPFVDILWEWRIIKINNSYFGHKKLLKGNYASGSGLVSWERPPDELLYLVKDICEKGNFYSMDVDIFETSDGTYYVNELQSLFGSYLDSQMYIDGKPGRIVFNCNQFTFEEGVYNQCGSCVLRVEHFIELLSNGTYDSSLNTK